MVGARRLKFSLTFQVAHIIKVCAAQIHSKDSNTDPFCLVLGQFGVRFICGKIFKAGNGNLTLNPSEATSHISLFLTYVGNYTFIFEY